MVLRQRGEGRSAILRRGDQRGVEAPVPRDGQGFLRNTVHPGECAVFRDGGQNDRFPIRAGAPVEVELPQGRRAAGRVAAHPRQRASFGIQQAPAAGG